MKRFKKTCRGFFSVIGVPILRLVSRRVSLQVNQLIGATLANIVFHLKPGTRKIAERNLAICFPKQTLWQRREIARLSFCELGKRAFEFDFLRHGDKAQINCFTQTSGNNEVLEQAKAKGGVIFVTLHLGCWEMVARYAESYAPLCFLRESSSIGLFEGFMRTGRDSRTRRFGLGEGCVGYPPTPAGSKRLLQACEEGANVLILPDQVPSRGEGVCSSFFGHPAYTMDLLGKLAQRATVVFVTAERLPFGGGYRLYFDAPPAEIYDADPEVSAMALNKMAERLICRFSHQYVWSYKRFQSTGDGTYRE